jgi:hypothetical protein
MNNEPEKWKDTITASHKTLQHVVCFLLGNSAVSEFYLSTFQNTLSVPSSKAGRYEDGTDSVPKCWHIKFRCRGITQKKEHNIQNTAKV